MFTNDGVYVTPAGKTLYAQIISEGLEGILAVGEPGAKDLPRAMRGTNMEGAVQMPITREMLSGEWEEVKPARIGASSWEDHFDSLWVTKTPGAKLTFTFTGTRAWIFNVFGPGTGLARITIDGVDKGTRQQADPWSYYYRLGSLEIGSRLPAGEHTVTVELLPDMPDRGVPMEAAKKANQYRPADFEGVALHLGAICVLQTP